MLDDKVPTSSIVMRAIDAKTFTALQEFTKDLDRRPVERLLADVAEQLEAGEPRDRVAAVLDRITKREM
ncbi:MAG TPA: hypothetical protein VLU46_02180 [Thermoanaerobaculia bacterium]|nr:hypothetical protein [Thermoanaerobaculia bacterium]